MSKKLLLFWFSILVSTALSYQQAHFIPREDCTALLASLSVLFLLFGFQFFIGKSLNFKHWLAAALLLRLSMLDSTPWLSDDYFRFAWDGILQNEGINPFAYLPSEIIAQVQFPEKAFLLEKMNSPNYYSVYPPLCQWIFYAAAKCSFGNLQLQIFLLKLSIFLFELGSILLLLKLLKVLKIPLFFSLLYLLHPLVILELSGNIHFEAGMIFSSLGAFYFLLRQKIYWMGIFLAIGISFKLWPLLFLAPLFFILSKKKASIVSAISILLTALAFSAFYFKGMPQNFSQSLALYFKHFEFHAGIHYWLKSFLDFAFSYEIRQQIMPFYRIIPLALMGIFIWKCRKLNREKTWLFIALGLLSIYLISGSIIHPWYILPLLLLSVFYRLFFPLFWTFLIPLTYLSYNTFPFAEKLWLNSLIHLALLSFILVEYLKRRKGFSSARG